MIRALQGPTCASLHVLTSCHSSSPECLVGGLWQTLLSPISKLEQKYFRSPMGKQERHVVAAVDSGVA